MELTVPLSFLVSASDTALENFELKRLAHAANLEKEAAAMRAEAQAARDAAGVAHWLRVNRDELLRTAGSHLDAPPATVETVPSDFARSVPRESHPVQEPGDPPGQPVADPPGLKRDPQRRIRHVA